MSFRTKALGGALVVAVGASGYVFSERSKANLIETHPDLQKVAACALNKSLADFVIVDGRRTAKEHMINVANGKSWVKRSRHQDGKAIDVAAYQRGAITYEPAPYYQIAAAFYYCGEELHVPIVWGGEWRVKDLMHFELEKGAYP